MARLFAARPAGRQQTLCWDAKLTIQSISDAHWQSTFSGHELMEMAPLPERADYLVTRNAAILDAVAHRGYRVRRFDRPTTRFVAVHEFGEHIKTIKLD